MAISPSVLVSVLQALSHSCSSVRHASQNREHVELVLRELHTMGLDMPWKHCGELAGRAAGRIRATQRVSTLELTDRDSALGQCTGDERVKEGVVQLVTQERLDLTARRSWLRSLEHRLQGVCVAVGVGLLVRVLMVWWVSLGQVLS
eukprot:TRINITY_DN27286_c0_g1_i1.p1 TRINITY_DN27286_c0_g1~~TRINITY_DN27286_c0_g1_i1.p1  ORF type:complete len:147 (+),score=24.90 TRINITY_DN27286_c0_g1_i1:66-506(+)